MSASYPGGSYEVAKNGNLRTHRGTLSLSLSRSTRNLNAWMCGCLDRRQPNSSQSTYYSVSTNSKFPPQCLEFLTEVPDCAPWDLARSLAPEPLPFPSLPVLPNRLGLARHSWEYSKASGPDATTRLRQPFLLSQSFLVLIAAAADRSHCFFRHHKVLVQSPNTESDGGRITCHQWCDATNRWMPRVRYMSPPWHSIPPCCCHRTLRATDQRVHQVGRPKLPGR